MLAAIFFADEWETKLHFPETKKRVKKGDQKGMEGKKH